MKKALLLFIFAAYFNPSEGQILTDSLKNSARNQFDIGVNFSYYFDTAPLKMDAITEAGGDPLNIISSLHFGYKRFISNRVCILIGRQQFHPGFSFFKPGKNSDFYSRGDLGWRAGYFNYGIGGGWTPKKK